MHDAATANQRHAMASYLDGKFSVIARPAGNGTHGSAVI